MRRIEGRKGGDAPIEQSDTLRAIQRAEIVDVLGEGQIAGLVNGLKSIYLDGVPVQNADDSLNFTDWASYIQLGGPTTEEPHSFDEVQTEVAVGVTVLYATPVVRTISDADVNAVRVTINVPAILKQQSNGDRVGNEFDWAIDVQSAGGGFVQVHADKVVGKATSPYPRSVRLDLKATGPAPWDIRVRRVSPDATSSDDIREFAWASYTAITSVRMLYRNTALCWITFNAKNFQAVPTRMYDVMGINDWDIPVNYDPLARTVSGTWDGTFTQSWTNSPPWILYGLIKNPRYGLGEYVGQLPDKWQLYQLQQWCDAPVPNGRGGTEPRYTINAVVNTQVEALRLLQDIAAVFRGVIRYSAGMLDVVWDAPSTSGPIFGPANVVGGDFVYGDGPRSQKKSSCTCWYNDLTQQGRRMPATWDDPELVEKYGLRTMSIDPLGVWSESQALRLAKWALFTSELEDQTISFKIGAQGATLRMGEVFQVSDPAETGERLAGRIHSATASEVVLDAPVTLIGGEVYQLWVMLPDPDDDTRLIAQSRPVTTGAGAQTTLAVSPAFTSAPQAETMWLLEADTVLPTLWRCVGITEQRNGDSAIEYEVTGILHIPGKWDLIELDQPIAPRPTRRLSETPPAVASIDIEETVYIDDEGKARIKVTVSWPAPAAGLRYLVAYRYERSNWIQVPATSATSMDFDGVMPGTYEVQVQSQNALGRVSAPTTATAVIGGDDRLPPNMSGLAYTLKLGQVWVTWAATEELRWLQSVLRVGGTDWDSADPLWEGSGSDYKHPRPANGTYKLWGKHRNLAGRLSADAAYLEVTVDDSIDGVGATGTVRLSTDRFPYFAFPDGTSHTTSSPDLGLQANLVGLFGTVAWAAEAFDAADASLGAVTLSGTGNTRTMSGAQFVAPGVSGSVRYVDVSISLGTANDSLRVYRADPTITEPRLYLSNPHHAVATDEAGENGDFSDATTAVAVFVGTTDDTAAWSIAITADAGVTATINGGAGPVTGTTDVTVAVSGMTVPTGAVLVEADKTGETTLSATFLVDKNEATGSGYQVVWTPRSEILLPITDTGAVSSYADAWSELKIIKGGALDDTANWALSKEDVNVTSTLVGAKVTVTALLSLGTFVGSTVSQVLDLSALGAGINGLINVFYGGGVWIALGWNYSGGDPTTSKIFRSTDFITWTVVDVGASAKWQMAAYDQGAWVIARFGTLTDTHKIRRSTDGGLTWSEVTLPTASNTQWERLIGGSGKMTLVALSFVLPGAFSTDGGATWSTWTQPSGGFGILALNASLGIALDGSGVVHVSTNFGASWTNDNSNWPIDPFEAIVYKGRLVASFWADTPTARYRDPGGNWVTVALPASVDRGRFQIVAGVLYMVSHSGGGTPAYTTDGASWKACSGPASAGWPIRGGQDQVDVGFYPGFALGSNQVNYRVLQANSDTDGAVILRANKPGALDIEAVLPVLKGTAPRDVYLFSAQPAYLVLPATADGVVTSFANAVMQFFAQLGGVDDTANWTWTWTTTNLTPASGTGSSVTLTGMSQSQDAGYIHVTFSKPGHPVRNETLNVVKFKGTLPSGPVVGGAYSAVTSTTRYIALRFNKDGRVQMRRSSGGSWLDLTQWAGLIHATANQGFFIKVSPVAGTHPLTSGTENTWLAMTSDRDFVMEDTDPGDHEYSFKVYASTVSTGDDPIPAFGSMTILDP